MPGIRGVVRMPDAVAVVADSWWRAKRAADALKVNWDDHGNGAVSSASIEDAVRGTRCAGGAKSAAPTAMPPRRSPARHDGFRPIMSCRFLRTTTMESQTCTAHVRAERRRDLGAEPGSGNRLATAAVAAGVPNENVKVAPHDARRRFGRRAPIQEYVRQAVVIAKEFKEPVKLVWSREQDIAHDLYRPCGMARLVAGLDDQRHAARLDGPVDRSVVSLRRWFPDFTNIWTGLSSAASPREMPYDVPNYLVDYVIHETPVPLACGVRSTTRRTPSTRNVSSTRWRTRRGWTPIFSAASCLAKARAISRCSTPRPRKPTGAGRCRPASSAASRSNEACGSYCAQVVEASVTDGRVRVHRVVSALDCGHVVNPLSIEMQCEGAIRLCPDGRLVRRKSPSRTAPPNNRTSTAIG